MSESTRIADQLERAIHGPAWHGPALLETLANLTAAAAVRRPLHNAHTIHEVALHAAAWLDIVRQRVEGAPPNVTEEMNWPAGDAREWPSVKSRISDTTRRLLDTIRALDDERLNDTIAGEEHPWTVYQTLHGAIQHALYHAGQIALLKKEI